MPSVLESICMIVVFGQFLVGVFANGFIGLVNCIEWVKTRRVTPIDFILTGLAIARIGTLWALMIMTFFAFLYFKRNFINNWTHSEVIWNISNHSSAWFGTCLSIFYFLKIANFSHPAFLWLKWRINKVVLRMLMGCLLISLVIILPVMERITKMQLIPSGQENGINISYNVQRLKTLQFSASILLNTGGLIPFALSVVSCFLLVLSLWRHTRKMHLKVIGSRDPNTEAHVRAMKCMISFLFLFVVYHLGLAIGVLNVFIFHCKLLAILSAIIMNVYPMTHSIILILGHSKLRQAFLRGLRKLPQHPWGSLSGRG
uniref:Taste receptor type 2 n=1 Tax=Monodelphis domestica TaxID=13616 RepID=Q2AB92_MONDO|nr:bitter taste receptor Modo-T2R27 [Monodelphis domestica]BAE80375.1 bitter taste receptor [Monodelphis domestica]